LHLNDATIAFVGAGNMARSLITGLLAAGCDPGRIRASDPVAGQRAAVAALGIDAGSDNPAAIANADVIVLAVKPQVLGAVVETLPLTPRQLVVSIAAGVPIASLERWTATTQPIVRCMPNTPALVGAGITALYANAAVSASGRRRAAEILGAAGRTLWVESEALLDAVTAVSGSGPAYFFYLMEAMIEAGVALGLPPAIATELTLETAYGAALMARAPHAETPATLRRNVTSPGGTTQRAIEILDGARVGSSVVDAITGAATRAAELAREFGR
jgi:pyrroline-5-carboxylate reductase